MSCEMDLLSILLGQVAKPIIKKKINFEKLAIVALHRFLFFFLSVNCHSFIEKTVEYFPSTQFGN